MVSRSVVCQGAQSVLSLHGWTGGAEIISASTPTQLCVSDTGPTRVYHLMHETYG